MDMYGFFSRTYIIAGCYTIKGNAVKGDKLDYSECLKHNHGSSEYEINWIHNEGSDNIFIWIVIVTLVSCLLILILFSCHLLIRKRNQFIVRLLPYQILIINGILKCPIFLLILGTFVALVMAIEIPIIFFQMFSNSMRFNLSDRQLIIEFSDNYVSMVVSRGINIILLYIPFFYNLYLMMRSPYNGFFNLEEILKDPEISLDSFNDGRNLELSQQQLYKAVSKTKVNKNKMIYLREIAKSCYEIHTNKDSW